MLTDVNDRLYLMNDTPRIPLIGKRLRYRVFEKSTMERNAAQSIFGRTEYHGETALAKGLLGRKHQSTTIREASLPTTVLCRNVLFSALVSCTVHALHHVLFSHCF